MQGAMDIDYKLETQEIEDLNLSDFDMDSRISEDDETTNRHTHKKA